MRGLVQIAISALVLAAAIGSGCASADETEVFDNEVDPSGSWTSETGELSLMHAGDTLSFSYSAVFGATVHLCDGAGVAGLVGRNRYQWGDAQGTVEFVVSEDTVLMETVDGVASFCGSGWPGDIFAHEGFTPIETCSVDSEHSHFAVVEPFSPEPRGAYVIKGDRVDIVPVRNEGCEDWVLARFIGKTMTTVGLLRHADLSCLES